MKKYIFKLFFTLIFISFININIDIAFGKDTNSDPNKKNGSTSDHGATPWTTDIEKITTENDLFRVSKWTGKHIQLTLMSIPPGGEIGGEVHKAIDQFIRVESGTGLVQMGLSENDLTLDKEISEDWAILIPAGYWHNLINTGNTDLKLYAIYGPPEHPKDTVHVTSKDAEEAHEH